MVEENGLFFSVDFGHIRTSVETEVRGKHISKNSSIWAEVGSRIQCRGTPRVMGSWSRDIVTPKTMCNYDIISRNERTGQKWVLLQSFSVLCYIFRTWEHFQINLIELYGWRASLALQQLCPIQILLIFLRFELPPHFIYRCYRPHTWQFLLICSCSFHF